MELQLRIWVIPALVAALLSQPVWAGSLSLEAHEIGTNDSFHSNWETGWGAYDRNYHRGKRLLVTVRDFSRKVSQCKISVYFLAHPVFNPGIHFIYDRKEFFPQFLGRMEVVGPVTAQPLSARVVSLPDIGQMYGRGSDIDGWIVVGRLDDEIFDIRASNQTLLAIAQGDPRQEQTLTDLVYSYEKMLARPH